MSAQDAPSGARRPPRSGGAGDLAKVPACPQCERRMTVKRAMPVLFASNLDDVIFGCDTCATESKRTIKRS